LDTLKITNISHQTQTRFCHFLAVATFVFIRFPASRDGLLKLYMLVKSARTVSQRVYFGLTSYG